MLTACSSMEITHDWDVEADFSRYHTYRWMPVAAAPAGQDADAARASNTLLDRRIRSAVDAAMASKGYGVAPGSPDVLVAYHTGLKDRVDVTDWGYVYSGEYWGWTGRDIDVQNVTEGTLIVDLVDASTHELLWRGMASGEVNPDRSPQERDRAMHELVARMFEKYPPKR